MCIVSDGWWWFVGRVLILTTIAPTYSKVPRTFKNNVEDKNFASSVMFIVNVVLEENSRKVEKKKKKQNRRKKNLCWKTY